MLTYLVDQGCKADFVDYLKQTALYYACRDGKCTLIKLLVDNGCHVNNVDTYGQTPLFYAAKNNHLKAVNFMVEMGGNPDFVDHNHQTPLYYAIKANHYDMCEFLLQRGANPNNCDKKKVSPFMQAHRAGRQKLCELLSDFGANEQTTGGKKTKKGKEKATPRKQESYSEVEKVHPNKELKRYVLSKYDAQAGVHVPMNKEEIVRFAQTLPDIAKYFNDPKECQDIPMNEFKEGKPIYDHWKKAAERILKDLWNQKDAWIFFEPVDPVSLNIPDYHNIVKEPMDLGTMKSNLKSGFYSSPSVFQHDMGLIFQNCILYNGETSSVSLMCKNVKDEFHRLKEEYQLDFYCKHDEP